MYKIDYNHKDSIIRLLLSGTVSLDMIDEMSKELYDSITNKNILLLTDARGAKYNFDFDDFTYLIELLNKCAKQDSMVHEAILIDSPKEAAISTMFEIENKKNYIYKIFSTEEAAISWLLNYKQ